LLSLLNVQGLLLFFLDVEGSYFYFLMLKVINLIFGCSKFLLLVLHVESFCFYFWILNVLTFVFGCWRFSFLLLDVESFCSWMLKVCDSWSSVYLHIWKINDVKIYFILFKSWLYKFSLTYNDERFMKGDFLMIIMLHMFCLCLNICDDFCCFYVIGPNFHYVSIH
jgi:hypothetical protein